MPRLDLTIEICGMSGDGTISAGGLLNDAMSGAGYSVLAFDSYPAEIRGFGRCVTRARIGEDRILALSDKTHVLMSLNDEQSQSRISFLTHGAIVIFDNNPPAYVPENSSIAAHVEPDANLYGLPLSELAAAATGSKRGRNLVALGGFAAVFGIPVGLFHDAIRKKFALKGERVLTSTLKSFDAGYRDAKERFADRLLDTLSASKRADEDEKILISGNEAVARGALDARLSLYFGYPITPATPIMEYLAEELPKTGGKLVQMEDEIASIGAVLGGFYAGKRSMTATSGPGLALMTELITHGIMSETPAVIVNAQRGGPATGLPTKTEQSDLQAAVWGGPGDSARIVIAPTDVPECYAYTMKSFQLAERYQTPVIVLTDFFLGNRVENVAALQPSEEAIADWNVRPSDQSKGRYHRYEATESGISPRAIPGMEGFIFHATGLEHSEKGLPNYTPQNHMRMTAKRHTKIRGALADLPEPNEFSAGGRLDVGVISWGSTFGSALEAVQKAQAEGLLVGAFKIVSIYPYHADAIREFMDRCEEILIPELNFEGQLANLIGHLHRKDVIRLNVVTGVPFSVTTILDKIKELVGAINAKQREDIKP